MAPRFFSLMLVVIATIMAAVTNASNLRSLAGASSVPLGECAQFAVMAGTSAAFNGELTTIFTGDIGVSPGTSVTGNFKQNDGSVEITSTKSNQCAGDRIAAQSQCDVVGGGCELPSGVVDGVCFIGAPRCVAEGGNSPGAWRRWRRWDGGG